jgi:prepilin-type N-terminal cleavage/methylation domain-containing protein
MQTLGIFLSHTRTHQGFSLVELMLVLSVLSLVGLFALPNTQRLLERGHAELARDQLMSDVQSARVRALQLGQALRLTRLNDCNWATVAGSDWSCGWQLQLADGTQTLQVTPLHTPLLVSYTKTSALAISAQGDLGGVGDRWTLSSRTPGLNVAYALCLNNTGRIRGVSGATCS